MHKHRFPFHEFPFYRTRYYLTRPWEYVQDVWFEVRDFIQRGLYGFAVSDTWSLDYYLNRVMPSAVRTLKAAANSYHPDMTFDDWQATLEKIARGFEAAHDMENFHHFIESEPDYLNRDWYQDYLTRCPYHTKAESDAAYAALEQEFNDGMALFVQHYRHLWD